MGSGVATRLGRRRPDVAVASMVSGIRSAVHGLGRGSTVSGRRTRIRAPTRARRSEGAGEMDRGALWAGSDDDGGPVAAADEHEGDAGRDRGASADGEEERA